MSGGTSRHKRGTPLFRLAEAVVLSPTEATSHEHVEGITRLVYWQKFDAESYEFEFDEEELAGHRVTAQEAREVFSQPFDVRRNKAKRIGYQVTGSTAAGRRLLLIVYERSKGTLRVITGWDL